MEQGIQLWGAADAIREALGTPIPLGQRSHYEETVAQVRTKYGETAFERAWEQGRTMTTEEAIACAVTMTE